MVGMEEELEILKSPEREAPRSPIANTKQASPVAEILKSPEREAPSAEKETQDQVQDLEKRGEGSAPPAEKGSPESKVQDLERIANLEKEKASLATENARESLLVVLFLVTPNPDLEGIL